MCSRLFKWLKLDKMGYRVPQPLRTMCYARNVSDHKLTSLDDNYCVSLMSINVKFSNFCPQVYNIYFNVCIYVFVVGTMGRRNNGLSEQWVVGIMGRRKNDTWDISVMRGARVITRPIWIISG